MIHTPRHWRALFVCLLLAGSALPFRSASAAAPDLASADQYKVEAFKALRAGQFALTNEYLTKAAAMSQDPATVQMATWAKQFESQRKEFADERRKEYEKAVANVRLLLEKGKSSYAIDVASKAYLLADDKKQFRGEQWVDQLIKVTIQAAKDYEAREQWLRALRIYSDLSSIEPSNPEWKDRLKTATRRVRLLAVYAPDALKKIQESETKEREEVDALLAPATRPHKPTTKPDEGDSAFKTDWRDMLRGVRKDMLRDALRDAVENYYRDVNYKMLATGGLKGLRVVATTKGLETTFAGLADAEKRQTFLKFVAEASTKAGRMAPDEGEKTIREIMNDLLASNGDTVQLPEEVVISEFADGAFGELDPFSNVIWPADLEEFQKATKGEFSGVGIQIQSDEDGSLKVVSPLEDSPAFKAGIKAGDIITHINGKNAKGITLNQAVKQITGPPRTTVTLTVRSSDRSSRDLTLVRETIKVGSVKGWIHRIGGGWDYFIDREQKIGYIRMTNFSQSTSEELDKAIEEMGRDGMRGIIFDLRYNPGGLLSAATEVADKFIAKGVIVSTRPDRETGNQRTRTDANPDKEKVRVPVVCLVNQYSASASEIVSGALKDHHRAIIIGERTFGKGSVQMLYPLDKEPLGRPKAYLKLTTSHYYLPSDKCIHREESSTEWGVDPDVQVEMTPEQMRGAIDARQEQDILRNAPLAPDAAPATKAVKRDPLAADAQLAAALLVMRMKLIGAQL